jgi:ADP-ribosylglycohydrolase
MRLAPVPMFFASEPGRAIQEAAASSTTTHGAPEAVDACRLLAAILTGLLGGVSKREVLSTSWLETMAGLEIESLSPKIEALARGGYKDADEAEVRGSGYVVESLEAALWAFWRSEDFREGALLAVNLGDDADTTGAVYGQLAGACYGMEGIPADWLDKLAWRERIGDLADQIYSKHA